MKGGPVGDRDSDPAETVARDGRASMKGGPVGDRDIRCLSLPSLYALASMKGGPVGDRDWIQESRFCTDHTPQ